MFNLFFAAKTLTSISSSSILSLKASRPDRKILSSLSNI